MSKENLDELMEVYNRLTPKEQYQLLYRKIPQNLIWVMPPEYTGRIGYITACRMIMEKLSEEERSSFIAEQSRPLIEQAYDFIHRFIDSETHTRLPLTQKDKAIAASYLIEEDSFTRSDLAKIFQAHGLPSSNLKRIIEELVDSGHFKNAGLKSDGSPSYQRNVSLMGRVQSLILRECSKFTENERS